MSLIVRVEALRDVTTSYVTRDNFRPVVRVVVASSEAWVEHNINSPEAEGAREAACYDVLPEAEPVQGQSATLTRRNAISFPTALVTRLDDVEAMAARDAVVHLQVLARGSNELLCEAVLTLTDLSEGGIADRKPEWLDLQASRLEDQWRRSRSARKGPAPAPKALVGWQWQVAPSARPALQAALDANRCFHSDSRIMHWLAALEAGGTESGYQRLANAWRAAAGDQADTGVRGWAALSVWLRRQELAALQGQGQSEEAAKEGRDLARLALDVFGALEDSSSRVTRLQLLGLADAARTAHLRGGAAAVRQMLATRRVEREHKRAAEARATKWRAQQTEQDKWDEKHRPLQRGWSFVWLCMLGLVATLHCEATAPLGQGCVTAVVKQGLDVAAPALQSLSPTRVVENGAGASEDGSWSWFSTALSDLSSALGLSESQASNVDPTHLPGHEASDNALAAAMWRVRQNLWG